ncbi:unnamed protein product [Gadus morhua 'NCC']
MCQMLAVVETFFRCPRKRKLRASRLARRKPEARLPRFHLFLLSDNKVRRLFTLYDLLPRGFGSDVDFSVHWLSNGITGAE